MGAYDSVGMRIERYVCRSAMGVSVQKPIFLVVRVDETSFYYYPVNGMPVEGLPSIATGA